MGFIEVEGFGVAGREGESWLDADEETVLLVGELGEGGKGGFEGFLRILGIFRGWAVRAEEIVADRGGVEDGESREAFGVKAESFVALELFVFFPS